VPLSDQRIAAIISNCERRAAVAVVQNAIAELAKLAAPGSEDNGDLATTLSFGVATASVVPKNFDPIQMIESAARCLSAARACGISAVKSIEV
jgi:PleD family two-component response regulator